MTLLTPTAFAEALDQAENSLGPEDVDLDVLSLVQAHVDSEYQKVLEAEGGDHQAAAIAFMLRGSYVGALARRL